MTRYEVLWDNDAQRYVIIAKDDYEDNYYVYLSDVDSKVRAEEIKNALNIAQGHQY